MRNKTSVDSVDLMDTADFASPAELFVSRRSGGSKRGGLRYHRFATAAQAIDFAIENFSSLRPDELVMAVDDKRFNLAALRTMRRDARLQEATNTAAEA